MRPITISSPSLIVVDMQRYFFEPQEEGFLKLAPAIVPNVVRLITSFRTKNLPIIFARIAYHQDELKGQMGRWWRGHLPLEGKRHSELISELKPAENEPVITKTRYSVFEQTEVESILKKHKVESVVLCGVMTHLCVDTTARCAFMLEFQPVVVSDACAAKSEEYHKAALLNLSHGFAHICDSETILSLLEKQ